MFENKKLNKYFEFKIKTKDFIENLNATLKSLKNKRVIVCGDSEGFIELNKQFNFIQKLNIIGFVEFNLKRKGVRFPRIHNYKLKQLPEIDFDYILITAENSDIVLTELSNNIEEEKLKYEIIFHENLRDAGTNLNFLLQHKFEEKLPKFAQKLKGKRILFYGGGLFFKLINEYYDLSSINAIGIVDKKLCQLSKNSEVCGYRLYAPEQIKELNPDYIIVSTRRIVGVYKELLSDYVKGTNIKVLSLVQRNLLSVIMYG